MDCGQLWSTMDMQQLLSTTITLQQLLSVLHNPQRQKFLEKNAQKPECCAFKNHNENNTHAETVQKESGPFSPLSLASDYGYFSSPDDLDSVSSYSLNVSDHADCICFGSLKSCKLCEVCSKADINSNETLKQKQKNDRESIRQKLAMDDFEDDKPWPHRRLDRTLSANNQNLQICYINDENSSSDEEDTSTVLPSPSFGRNKVFHPGLASSSSSTLSLASASSLQTPDTSEVITLKHDGGSVLERMEYDARIALTHAHEAARIRAHVERMKRQRHNASVAINEDIRTKVRLRALKRNDCQRLSIDQLHVVVNDMHKQKEEMNQQLVQLLMMRDDLKTEQDAKLMDVEDAKSLMLVTGPETTV